MKNQNTANPDFICASLTSVIRACLPVGKFLFIEI